MTDALYIFATQDGSYTQRDEKSGEFSLLGNFFLSEGKAGKVKASVVKISNIESYLSHMAVPSK